MTRRLVAVAVGLAALGGSGCIQHQVRLLPPPGGPPPGTTLLVGNRYEDPHRIIERTSPMPLALSVTAWAQAPLKPPKEDACIWRIDLIVRTPRPWWQRFPCDIVANLLPWTCTARTQMTLAYRPITPQDGIAATAAMEAEAQAHGYARHPRHER